MLIAFDATVFQFWLNLTLGYAFSQAIMSKFYLKLERVKVAIAISCSPSSLTTTLIKNLRHMLQENESDVHIYTFRSISTKFFVGEKLPH